MCESVENEETIPAIEIEMLRTIIDLSKQVGRLESENEELEQSIYEGCDIIECALEECVGVDYEQEGVVSVLMTFEQQEKFLKMVEAGVL